MQRLSIQTTKTPSGFYHRLIPQMAAAGAAWRLPSARCACLLRQQPVHSSSPASASVALRGTFAPPLASGCTGRCTKLAGHASVRYYEERCASGLWHAHLRHTALASTTPGYLQVPGAGCVGNRYALPIGQRPAAWRPAARVSAGNNSVGPCSSALVRRGAATRVGVDQTVVHYRALPGGAGLHALNTSTAPCCLAVASALALGAVGPGPKSQYRPAGRGRKGSATCPIRSYMA